MKDFYVADAARHEGQTVTTFFALSQVQLRERKGTSGQYLALTLTDRTGSFEARMWEEFAEALTTCGEGCYVKVQGVVSKYQGRFQITVSKMRHAPESEVDASDFVAVSTFSIPEMERELRAIVAGFDNPDLSRLVLAFLDDPEIGPAFFQAPAAKLLHHAWLGGLLEHVLTLCKVLRALAPFYPEADPDLVATGAILHDIGKVRELAWRRTFSYTLEGQLIGHISIAQRMLADKLRELAPFPPRLAMLVEHMILAHHGRLEFGSPKLPMTPEALLFSAVDDLEAKFASMRREFAAAESAGGKPDQPTEWVRSMERPLFNSQRWLTDTNANEAGTEPQAISAADV
jgi:3'-5' exoribonuclease